jgi:hypothetical protein
MFPIFETSFSHDWNTREGEKVGKLQCSTFTTLRLYSTKFAVSNIHRIVNNSLSANKLLGHAVVLQQMAFSFYDLHKYEVLCRLDTGYNATETANILRKMYPKIIPETQLNFVLMRYLTAAEIKRMNKKIEELSSPKIPLA